MPSELDTHDILFNPLKRRRAEQAARRAADRPSNPDRDAPTTDRPVAYAIADIADADAGPLISSKLIGGIAVMAAIFTVAVLVRTPELGTSTDSETVADETMWWTAARQQWADDNMRTWPLLIRASRSEAKAAKVSSKAQTIPPAAARVPARTNLAARSDNPYSSAPRTKPVAPAKDSDNPYGDSRALRAGKPAAARTDNPY